MNFKFSIAVAAAFLMLASVANAQSGSQPAAPAFGSGARAAAPTISAPTQTIQSVPSAVGSGSRIAAPTQTIQSVPSAVGSSSRLAAPVVDTYVAPTEVYSAPTQSYSGPVETMPHQPKATYPPKVTYQLSRTTQALVVVSRTAFRLIAFHNTTPAHGVVVVVGLVAEVAGTKPNLLD